MLKSMNHLAIISTPLQYLNLLELIESSSVVTYRNCVLLLVSPFKKSIEQINVIGNIERFERVCMPMVFSSSRVLNFLLTYVIFRIYRNRTPILGNLNNTFCQAALKTKKTPIVLDDGAGTIIIANKRMKNNFAIGEKNAKSSSRYLRLMSLILKPVKEYSLPLTFFTSYKNLVFNTKDSIIINKYDFLKRTTYRKEKKERVNECWFAGVPFVQLKMITQEKYNEIILSIASLYEKIGLKFVYFPHRIENDFRESFTHKIVENEFPFEFYIAKAEKEPKIIASFYSSVLITSHNINMQIEINAIELQSKFTMGNDPQRIHNLSLVYEYLGKQPNTSIITLVNNKNN